MTDTLCVRAKHLRAWVIAGAFLIVFASTSVKATPLQLIYNGVFNSLNSLNPADGATQPFTSPTPFTIKAWFDTDPPNLAPTSPPAPPPFAGFRAYAPSLVTITIGAETYTIETITTNPTAGAAVAIFDQGSFFPGRYGVGILQQPVEDGAGIVGDFISASPDFTVDSIGATTFTNYAGVGYSSGVCLEGVPGACTTKAVTPFVLRDSSNQVWNLTLGNFEEDYPDVVIPGHIPGPLNSAELVVVPEPTTMILLGTGLAGVGVAIRRKKKKE